MILYYLVAAALSAWNQLGGTTDVRGEWGVDAMSSTTWNQPSVRGASRRVVEVPHGLLFASEMGRDSVVPSFTANKSSPATITSSSSDAHLIHDYNNSLCPHTRQFLAELLQNSSSPPNVTSPATATSSLLDARLNQDYNNSLCPHIHQFLAEESENLHSYFQVGQQVDHNHKIEYRNHPFDLMRERRGCRALKRALRECSMEFEMDDASTDDDDDDLNVTSIDTYGDSFQPIRIHIDTSALDLQRTAANGAKIDLLKSVVLPRMRDFWSSVLSVVPVRGNLIISPADLVERSHCGNLEYAKVPPSHFRSGVVDADVIMYVSGTPMSLCEKAIATAVRCNFDQFDRPTAGAINFCLDRMDSQGSASESLIESYMQTAMHEAAHVLGMSGHYARYFWDPSTGLPRSKRPLLAKNHLCVDGVERNVVLPDENTLKFFNSKNGERYALIVTEKVKTVVRNQFNCQELEGAPLENQEDSCTGYHWDKRMFYPELLAGRQNPSSSILSPLTFAFFEDSGWYKANYTLSEVSPWGHGVGCDFLTGPCLVGGGDGKDASLPSSSKGFFCSNASSKGCSSSHTHKMQCSVYDHSSGWSVSPPTQFQYFSNQAFGGLREVDYCPVYGSTHSGLTAEQLDCRIRENQGNADVLYSEEYGENSMCFDTTSGEGRCYQARCNYEDFNLRLQVDGKWYTCTEDFEEIEVSTVSWVVRTTVTCPRLSSVCPSMFCPGNCAGRGTCNFNHLDSNDIKHPRCQCFDKGDNSAGCSGTFVLDEKYLLDGGSLTDKPRTNLIKFLIKVFSGQEDSATVSIWGWIVFLTVVNLWLVFNTSVLSSLPSTVETSSPS